MVCAYHCVGPLARSISVDVAKGKPVAKGQPGGLIATAPAQLGKCTTLLPEVENRCGRVASREVWSD